MMRILAVTPVIEKPEDECIDGFNAQTMSNIDWLIMKDRRERTEEMERERRERDMDAFYYDLVERLNIARNIVLNQDYDCLLTLEADIVMKRDVVSSLARFIGKYDIAVAPYRLRPSHAGHSHVCLLSIVNGAVGYNISGEDTLRYYRAIRWNMPFTVAGSGFGCTLISRKVLENVSFRYVKGYRGEGPDIIFFNDCYKKYSTICVPVDVGHKENNEILWLDDAFFDSIVYKMEVSTILLNEMTKSMLKESVEKSEVEVESGLESD